MEIFSTKIKTNLDGVLQTTQMIDGIMMTGDNAANQILVEVYRGLTRIDLDPETKILGYFIRPDGYTLEEPGRVNENNEIEIVIPEVAYQVSGTLSIAIRMFSDPLEKTVITRQYPVTKIIRKYNETVTTRKYLKIVKHRRYYDDNSGTWIDLADGEEPPTGVVVEVYYTGVWVALQDGEEAPSGSTIRTRRTYVKITTHRRYYDTDLNDWVVLQDGEDPPSRPTETYYTGEWVPIVDGEEAPAGSNTRTRRYYVKVLYAFWGYYDEDLQQWVVMHEGETGPNGEPVIWHEETENVDLADGEDPPEGSEAITVHEYYQRTAHRRYYDEDTNKWIDLADGEEPPALVEVEEFDESEVVELENGEEAPDGAAVTTINEYYQVTPHRRYFDETTQTWINLADEEQPPINVEVEEYQTTEWVTLEDGELPPDGAQVEETVNHVTVILEDGIEPPEGVNVEIVETTEWIILGDNEEPPEGVEVTETSSDVITWATKVVVAALSCYIRTTETNQLIDTYHHIPDIQELLEHIALLDSRREAIDTEEAARVNAERARVIAEAERVQNYESFIGTISDNESGRQQVFEQSQTERQNAFTQAQADRQQAFTQAQTSRQTTFEQSEADRALAEVARVSAENDRVTAEGQRASAEAVRQQTFNQSQTVRQTTFEQSEATRQQTFEQSQGDRETSYNQFVIAISGAERLRAEAESGRVTAESQRQAAQAARNAMIDNMTVAAQQLNPYDNPTATISEVNGHKHILIGLAPGDPFVIAKTFPSVAAMNSYTGTDIRVGQFVVIASNEEDPDNAKMYVKTTSGYTFVTDLSGAQGIQGPRGYTGNGISSTSLNTTNYTLTINFTDGTSYTTESIRGLTGATGNGIASTELLSDYRLKITMTDGTTYTTPNPIRGEKGERGEPGEGSAILNYDTSKETLEIAFY